MSAFGVAFIGNIWALPMFGIGLLLRGYSATLFAGPMFETVFPNGDLMAAYIPHGFMIGAGLVALLQVGLAVPAAQRNRRGDRRRLRRRSAARARRSARRLSSCIAVLIAAVGGLFSECRSACCSLFVLYAAFAAYVHELIVGLAAMHSGWFPAFAVALITLIIGMMIGFPMPALALLVGFSAATGPAFADMGYDLKAGYLLRGNGADPRLRARRAAASSSSPRCSPSSSPARGRPVLLPGLFRAEPRRPGRQGLCRDDQGRRARPASPAQLFSGRFPARSCNSSAGRSGNSASCSRPAC